MDNHFGIGVGIELMSAAYQLFAQMWIVINLSIEHHPNAAVFVVDWLLSTGKIDNAQAPHAQAHATLGIDSFVIRAAVDDGLSHAADLRSADNLIFSTDQSGYSTHGWAPNITANVLGCGKVSRQRTASRNVTPSNFLHLFNGSRQTPAWVRNRFRHAVR